MPSSPPSTTGRVYLVGAGPGDPGLITLRGVECLRQADLVLYDYLANPRVLEHVNPQAEKHSLGRHGHERIWTQAEINDRLIAAARQGKKVVRLKSGDPLIFGRAGEEMSALHAAGVPFEIVPGVTAALASAGYAGVPLTHRDWASAVALVTGQENSGKPEPGLDYQALAKFPGTLVFYMGATTARHWSAELIRGGKSPGTPAVIVRRCSWPDQAVYRCTLATVGDEIERQRIRPPVLVIVGEVGALVPVTSWFQERPLFGQRILVTRPVDQSGELLNLLCDLGADCLVQPAIEITDPVDWRPVDAIIEQLEAFDWSVFSSSNGVRYFLNRIRQRGKDARAFGTGHIAAIGPGTALELSRQGLRADLQPGEYRAEALAAALAPFAKGKRILLLRASRGREVLAEALRQAGALVEQVVVYTSRDVRQPIPEIAQALSEGQLDWVTVSSSAIARSLVGLFGESLRNARLASISPITSETLRQLGFSPAIEAADYTMAGLAEMLRKAVAAARRAAQSARNKPSLAVRVQVLCSALESIAFAQSFRAVRTILVTADFFRATREIFRVEARRRPGRDARNVVWWNGCDIGRFGIGRDRTVRSELAAFVGGSDRATVRAVPGLSLVGNVGRADSLGESSADVKCQAYRLSATWGVADPGLSAATELLRGGDLPQEIALLGDAAWIGSALGRSRVTRELDGRMWRSEQQGIRLSSLLLRKVELNGYANLFAERGFTAFRGDLSHVNAEETAAPRSLSPGLWHVPLQQSLPKLGGFWTRWRSQRHVLHGLKQALSAGQVWHIGIDASHLATLGQSGPGQVERLFEQLAQLRETTLLRVESLSQLAGRLEPQSIPLSAASILRPAAA